MNNKTKQILIRYNFRSGEYEQQGFTSCTVPGKASTKKIEATVRNKMKDFYGDKKPEVDGDTIYYFGGEIAITIKDYDILLDRDYEVLQRLNVIS